MFEILSEANLKIDSEYSYLPLDSSHKGTEEASIPSHWEHASFSETITANINVRIPPFDRETEYKAFEYTHKIEWEHQSLEGVRAIQADGDGYPKSYILAKWEWDGDTNTDVTIRSDGNFFNSDRTAEFDRCILISNDWSCSATDRLYTRAAGNWNGSGSLTREELR